MNGTFYSPDFEILYRRGTEQYRQGGMLGWYCMREVDGAMDSLGQTVRDMCFYIFRIFNSGSRIWVSPPSGGFTGSRDGSSATRWMVVLFRVAMVKPWMRGSLLGGF